MPAPVVGSAHAIAVVQVCVEAATQAFGHRIFKLLIAPIPKADLATARNHSSVFLVSRSWQEISSFWKFHLISDNNFYLHDTNFQMAHQ